MQQNDNYSVLNSVSKEAFFQCDKETISFKDNGKLQLNMEYKQEFDLTNISEKELDIEFYTTGFKEPHEIVFSPNSCITFHHHFFFDGLSFAVHANVTETSIVFVSFAASLTG